jgi:CheY-like chemotaxis protein
MERKRRFEFDFSGKSVLVVEDTMMSFKLMKAVLDQVDARVLHAHDGDQAIAFCQSDEAIDLVIMDLQLPGMHGLEATREVKKFRPSLPVIAATANTFDDEEAACRAAGCDGFITKPLKFEKLFQLMQTLFERQA